MIVDAQPGISEVANLLRRYWNQTLDEGGARYYARVRQGRTKDTAATCLRRDLAEGGGETPDAIAREALARRDGGEGRAKAWIEVCDRADRCSVVDALYLGRPPEDGGGAGGADPLAALDPETAGIGGLAVAMTAALVQTNGQLSARLSGQEQLYHDLMARHIDTAARATAAETILALQEKYGADRDGYSEAIQQLIPVLGPVVGRVIENLTRARQAETSPPPAPAEPDPAPAEPGARADALIERADRLLGDAAALVAEHPAVVAPRAGRILALAGRAAGLRSAVEGAMGLS